MNLNQLNACIVYVLMNINIGIFNEIVTIRGLLQSKERKNALIV